MFLQSACPRFLVPLRVTGRTYDSPSPKIFRGTGGSLWRSFGSVALGALWRLALLKKTGLCCLVLADVLIRHVRH
jgi:hypothetical protein